MAFSVQIFMMLMFKGIMYTSGPNVT